MIVGSSRYLRETNLLLCFAADHFVSCVGDRASAWDPAMIYSSIDPSAHNRRSCHAACRRGGHTRYSLDVRGYCLCGSPRGRTSPSPETARCSSVCSNPVPARACGRSVVRSVYEVRLGLMATGRCVYSLYEPVVLTLAGSGLISRYMWDFGDGSVAWNTSSRSAQYKYGLPGRYWVRVQAFTSFEVLSLSQELVVIMVIDGRVGLQCPGLVEAGGSVDIWLQTWQGTQMSAEWRVTSSNGHEETGEDLVLFPPIFPLTNGHCYWLSQVKESWRRAQQLCQQTPGTDLVSVNHQDVQNFIQQKDVTVYPDDVIGIQHDAGPGCLLGCQSSSKSPWRQSYISLEQQSWVEMSLTGFQPAWLSAKWVDSVVCDVRVLYTEELRSFAVTPLLSTGQTQAGTYTYSVTVANKVSSVTQSCRVEVRSKITGLQIIFPRPLHGRLQVPTNSSTVVVIKILSGSNATASWGVPIRRSGVRFESGCPPDVPRFAPACRRETGDTWFAHAHLTPTDRRLRTLSVAVSNDISSQNLSVLVQAHDAIGGLRIVPPGPRRMLVDLFSPAVTRGTSVTYTWVIDDLTVFAYTGQTYIIFPWASVVCVCVFVRLCVCACVCVCVCACQPHGTLTGTGNLKIFSSALGDYNLEVETRNRWAFTKKCLSVYARSPLSDLKCVQTPEFPYIDGNVDFEAFPHPSPFGITYTWDFNDQSPHPVTVGRNSTVQHRFQRSGVYNVTLWANNTISAISTHVLVSVVERISGLAVSTNGPNELGVATLVKGKVSQGTNIVWSFDMGDGYIFRNLPKSNVSYIYAAEGNYKVTVSSSNMVNSVNRSVDVNVYALRIMEVMPSGCLVSGQNSFFKARISGSQNNIKFSWNFGDGGPTVGIQGNSSIVHAYSLAGNYTIRINVSSPFNTAYSQAGVCIESLIDSVQLVASNKSVRLNELVQFIAEVVPSEDNQHQYTYLWDFGIGESPILGNGAVSSLYKEVGVYLATVCVSNRIDSKSESCSVVVQESVGKFSVSHDGSNQTTLSLNKTYRFKLDVVSGTNVTFTWDFGDDTSARLGQNPSHAYSNSGVFTVSAIGTNLVSRMESYLNVMVLTPITELKINTNRLIVEIGKEVTFTATLSGGDQVCFFWAVCRGCIRQEGTSLFKHRFQGLGIYDVLLTARNYVSEERDMISLQAQEKMLDLEIYSEDLVQDSYCATKEDCKLLARVASGSNMTYGWLISQGPATRLRGRGSSMVFHPEAAGDYLAIVLAENGLGAVNQSKRIFVQERISGVKVTGTAESVAIGIPVNLSVSVISGTDLLYQWFLGTDENILTTSISSISYIYLSLGTVVVNVTVSNVLGSADGSMALRVQEAVSRVSYTLLRAVPPFYVPSNATARYQGHAGRGSDITWQWSLPEDMGSEVLNGSEITYTFKRASVYPLTLNASNEVSWESVSHNITVQDCVRGLMIRADKAVARVGDPVIFTISVQRGTSVWYSLYFPTFNVSVFLQGDTYEMVFPAVGENTVTATAWNNVSSEVKFTRIVVVEEITGLHWVSCCPAAVEVNKERTFTAEVRAGLEVIYRWDFQLPGSTDYHLSGQSVSYTPHREGALTVHVKASNAYSTLSLMEVIRVQFPVAEAELWSNGTDLYVNQTVMFRVTIAGGSDVYYRWSFGNSQNVYVNQNSTALYHYTTPDDYAVEVTAYNNISFFVTRLGVTVRKPECVMPEVQLVEPPHTIFRARVNYFEASVDLKGCTLYKTHYLWEAFRASSCEEAQAVDRVFLGNVDTSKPLLVLPKLLLNTSTYCLQFTVSLHRTPLLRSVSFRIRVLQSKLVPVIGGGSRRAWAASQDLLLAGSKSYDPDTKTSEEACCCCLQILSSPPCLSPASQTKATLTIPRKTLLPGNTYVFTLTVSKWGKEAASVLIQAERVPCVLLECISCNALSSYRVSRSIHVTLAGQCENCSSNTSHKWTVQSSDGFPLTLDNQTTSTGDSNPDLVIRQGVLRNGVNYTFTLSVMDPEKHSSGFSSIMLTPNYPPSGGVCTVKPDTVFYLLETVISVNCTGWLDEDGGFDQLIYSLIAMSCLDRSDACHQYHLYRGIRSSFSALVPAGTQGNTSAVSIVVEVEDLLGAKTTAVNRTLTVLMPELPSGFQNVTDWLKSKSQRELWGLVQQGNPNQVIPYSIALLSNNGVSEQDVYERISIRSNVTLALTSLHLTTVEDVTQLSAAMAQCAVCNQLLPRLLTPSGTDPCLATETSFLLCAGGALAAVDGSQEDVEPPAGGGITSASVFQLTNQLMKSLMRSRVLNEEPLSLSASGIEVHGKRTNPLNLLCARFGRGCPFHVPDALSGQLSGHREVVQVLMNIGVNPFLAGSIGHYSVSTRVASMEFTTPGGTRIPINDLPGDQSIQVILANNSARRPGHSSTAMSIVAGGWVNFTVRPVNSNRAAGLHIQLTLTAYPEARRWVSAPWIVWLTALMCCIPAYSRLYDTTAPYNINVSSRFSSVPVNVSVTVYTSLCQYFDLEQLRWRTNGMVSTHRTTPGEAVCLTRHLTVFGASMFVSPDAVEFLPPADRPAQNLIVVITCALVFAVYVVMALIAHKLDHIDINSVGIVPVCGQHGRYKYGIMVKTGWCKNSGTTAHVGISLYGLNKSGSRHLGKEGAFQRNSLDVFQIETDTILGEIWKIRIWHDNTGLDPSWHLEHVIVWDKQTDSMYFFLVRDWLSVENEKNEGMVEKEVLAACEYPTLRSFSRIFLSQLKRGMSEKHIWLSVWDRLPRSRFTRVQRVTCCTLLLYLFLAAVTAWYGAVGVKSKRVPVVYLASVTGENVAVGIVVALVVFPVHLLFTLLFRRTRSKVRIGASREMCPDLHVWNSVVRRAAGTDAVMSANKCLPFGTGVSKSPKKWLFPHWVLYVTYLVCFLLIAASVGVTVTYGRLFHNNVVLMWLISAFSSFLTLFFVLEPIKVLCEALLLALVTKPVDPDEDDNLVEEPLIKKMSEKISKVRPPYGYGLLQAKEEARKVRALHTIMKVREILTKAQHRRSMGLYDSGGYTQELGNNFGESSSILWDLRKNNWIDPMTRAVFVEFTQYNHNVDLHVVLTLLLEFPAVGSVASTVDIKPITMMRSSQGANLQLVMMVSAESKPYNCTCVCALSSDEHYSLLRGLVTLQRAVQQYPASGSIYFISYLACLLWIMARLFSAIIIHSYKVVRVEMYRPAIEPQDYEMIEFFIKRFKLWIGLSKAKEFRHKVKFDGMESLPSRSSRNSKLSRFPSVSADSHYSDSSISSGSMRSVDLNIPESPAGVAYDVQLYLDRLLPTVNSLLGQFDRVNKVTYDLYQIEAGLESVQCKINTRKQSQVSREMVNVQKRMNHPATMQLVLPRTYSTESHH
uniref:Polycystic kidney disease 1a n=1 Tax=Callorhinchus milii TaxID=7868 RepID=A0A4W3JYE4_CALMI